MHKWEPHPTVEDLHICIICKMARYLVSKVDSQQVMDGAGKVYPQTDSQLANAMKWLKADITRWRDVAPFGCVYLYSGVGYYAIEGSSVVGNWFPDHDNCIQQPSVTIDSMSPFFYDDEEDPEM